MTEEKCAHMRQVQLHAGRRPLWWCSDCGAYRSTERWNLPRRPDVKEPLIKNPLPGQCAYCGRLAKSRGDTPNVNQRCVDLQMAEIVKFPAREQKTPYTCSACEKPLKAVFEAGARHGVYVHTDGTPMCEKAWNRG